MQCTCEYIDNSPTPSYGLARIPFLFEVTMKNRMSHSSRVANALRRISFPALLALLASCGSSEPSRTEESPTGGAPSLDKYLIDGFHFLDDKELSQALEDEFGRFEGRLARIGKVTVRLWHPEPDHPEKSEFPEFLPSRAVTQLQQDLVAAVHGNSGRRLPYRFLGCGTTQFLRAFGKPELNAGPEAAEACGYLVNRPQEGRLRQFEFITTPDNRQYILVTTDIFQRGAFFEATTQFKDRVLLLARPDSWGSDLELLAVNTVREYSATNSSHLMQKQELKRALRLFNEPSSLADASKRWYDKQVHYEARKPIIGGTLAAGLALVGVSEFLAGMTALTTAASGSIVVGSIPGVAATTATQTVTTLATIGGIWKVVAGFFLATSSAAEVMQVQRMIDLEGNPQRRANLQFSYTLFNRAASLVSFADLIVANPILFKLVTRNYIKGKIVSTLAAQKAEFDRQAAQIATGALKKGADDVSKETLDLFHEMGRIAFRDPGNFTQKVSAMMKRAADHGELVRAAGGQVADAHKLAGEIALRGPGWYKDFMNGLSMEAIGKVESLLGRHANARQAAEAIRAVKLLADRAAMEAAVKFLWGLVTPPAFAAVAPASAAPYVHGPTLTCEENSMRYCLAEATKQARARTDATQAVYDQYFEGCSLRYCTKEKYEVARKCGYEKFKACFRGAGGGACVVQDAFCSK